MPANVIEVAARFQAVQYDGTNGAAIASALGATFGSDNGSTCTFTLNGDPWSLTSGQWFVWADDGSANSAYGAFSTADYQARYAPIPHPSAVGAEDVPALLLGADTDVDVTLSRPMAGTSYDVESWLVGAHGMLTKNTTSIVDESTVRVNVSAGLAYTSGAQVLVAAHGQVA